MSDRITEFKLSILYIKPPGKHACAMQTETYRGNTIIYYTGRAASIRRFRMQQRTEQAFDLVCIEYGNDINDAVTLACELKAIDPAACLVIKAKNLADLQSVEAEKQQAGFSVFLDEQEETLLSRAIEESLNNFMKRKEDR